MNNQTKKIIPFAIGAALLLILLGIYMGNGSMKKTKKESREQFIQVRIKKFFYELVDMVVKNKDTQAGFASGVAVGSVFSLIFPTPVNLIALLTTGFMADIPSEKEKEKHNYSNSEISNAAFYGAFSSILLVTMFKKRIISVGKKVAWPPNWFKKKWYERYHNLVFPIRKK